MKRCLNCRKKFTPTHNSMQPNCSPECAIAFAKARPERLEKMKKRAARAEKRALKERYLTKSAAAATAQRHFNRWIRWRDQGLPCVSCGCPYGSRKWNAGHYIPVARSPALRFDEANVHGQCEKCNGYESGSLTAYRPELIRRIGLDEVLRLEGPHELPHRTVEEIQEIQAEYSARLRRDMKRRAA